MLQFMYLCFLIDHMNTVIGYNIYVELCDNQRLGYTGYNFGV